MKIVDTQGVWLQNMGEYRLTDVTASPHVHFEPGEPTKALHSDYLKDQPTIKIVADPNGGQDEAAQAKILEAQNAEIDAARADKEAAAEAAMQQENARLTGQTVPGAPEALPDAPDTPAAKAKK